MTEADCLDDPFAGIDFPDLPDPVYYVRLRMRGQTDHVASSYLRAALDNGAEIPDGVTIDWKELRLIGPDPEKIMDSCISLSLGVEHLIHGEKATRRLVYAPPKIQPYCGWRKVCCSLDVPGLR